MDEDSSSPDHTLTEDSPESSGRARSWRSRSALARIGLAALATLLVGALLFWLTLPDPSEFSDAWPERTAYMELRERQASEREGDWRIDYRPVPLSSIPEAVQRAVLVSEDAAFYEHGGFDWHEIEAAVRQAWEERSSPRGASTITQQLARNLYLGPDRNLFRKLREAAIARRLEKRLGKRRIFELYLSVIEFGPGIFGVAAASRQYFGTPISGVGERQAAQLSATIPSPLRNNPATATRNFNWRTELIYARAFGSRPESVIPEVEPPVPPVVADSGG